MPSGGEKQSFDRGRALALALAGLALLAVLGVALLSLGSTSDSAKHTIAFVESPYPNVDLSNSRHAWGPIERDTVSDLGVAWTLPIAVDGSSSGSAASPVVAGGIVYTQDLASNVQAIELEGGEVLWEKTYGSSTVGPNGVLVADGFVYGATKTHAFALDRRTGEEVWSTPLLRSESERIAMAPGYSDGLVYVSTVPAAFDGGEVGILWALDGETGRKVWSFDTVPKGLWGNRSLNFGGGLTHSPAFDTEGSMYVGIGNPGPIPGTERFPWGSSRPGPNLYTDSIVKLDAKTGKVQWHYQVAPHDVCNGDIGPPVLVEAGGRTLVIASGKSGMVVALDPQSGKLVWRRAVGVHTGQDRIGLYAMRGEYSRLKTPMTIYPGKFGGVFAPLAVNGSTVFVPVINYGAVVISQTKQAAAPGAITGELVALNVASGAVKWKRKLSSPLRGAPIAVNDLVFAAASDGALYAFDSESGRELWKTSLPAGFNAGLTVSGSTLLAPAGDPVGEERTPQIVAYRLRG